MPFFSLCFFHFVDSGSTSGVVAWLLFSLKIRNVLLYDVISFSFDIAGKKKSIERAQLKSVVCYFYSFSRRLF